LNFIRAYISALPLDNQQNVTATEEAILREAFVFVLASHFLWGLWSIINAQTAKINFGYWDYAVSRFDAYFQHKSRVMNELSRRKFCNPSP